MNGNLNFPDLAPSPGGVLRFITAGSVDDGKSTLIGRLLFDSKGIFADQLAAMRSGTAHDQQAASDDAIDFALLTDGLEAEREQGITIDVAYRYFATPRRKFIIADTPGHEQYTRNMVTGASTADAMILLIDAGKVIIDGNGDAILLRQTRRHSTLAQLLRVRHVIVAVNKMDQVDYDARHFERIAAAYAKLAAAIGVTGYQIIPLAALNGDNVVTCSERMPWYQGAPLITMLEALSDDTSTAAHDTALRFPVQWVARHNGREKEDFRGYMGRVERGVVRVGQEIVVQPSGHRAQVKRILLLDQAMPAAQAGQSVTLVLDRDLDISRGDLLNEARAPAVVTGQFQADLCWLAEEALDLRRKYLLRHATRTTVAQVRQIETRLEVDTQARLPAETLALNDIARVRISVQQPLAADTYADSRQTGAFVLIDELSHQTVAAGMISQLTLQ